MGCGAIYLNHRLYKCYFEDGMTDKYIEYLVTSYKLIPNYIYIGALAFFIFGLCLILCVKGVKKRGGKIAVLMLVEYVVLVYCSTVLFRKDNGAYRTVLQPFQGLSNGTLALEPESVLNIVFYIPIGFLLGTILHCKRWWIALLVGCCVSMSVELLQHYLSKGFAETDDVICNVGGCMLGYCLYVVSHYAISAIKVFKYEKRTTDFSTRG